MSRSSAGRTAPVIVAGAGPAGLVAAVTLARLGVEVLVAERRLDESALPRATALSLRSMELLRAWGLESQVLAGSVDVELSMFELPTVARAHEGRRIEVGYPSATQAAMVSPVVPACVPQDHLESVLLEHLATLPSATVLRGVEVVDVVPTDSDVVVRLKDVRSGAETALSTHHLIAADGARSTVRAAVGIDVEGDDALVQGVRAELVADLWSMLGEHRHGIYSVLEPSPATLLPAGPGDRWLFGFESPTPLGADVLERRFVAAVGDPGLDVTIRRVDWFSSGAKVATRFSAGRVHLVGDAAHQVTPRGGTGLNTAMADGHDLGWKVGWVVRGWAERDLLASYEQERRPVALHNVRRSADPMGSRRHVLGELQVDLGGRVPHVWVGERSTVDLLGPGLTAFVGPDASAPVTSPGPPVEIVRLDAMGARFLGLGVRDSLLVRPDGVAVGTMLGYEAVRSRRTSAQEVLVR